MINFEYTRAFSVKAALDMLAKNPTGRFIAGGSNIVDLMKRGVVAPDRLIDINNLPLKQIEENAAGLIIGALAINSEVAENEIVKKNYPLLAMALKAGASPQLRNMATVGGNIMQRTRCPYFYDTTMPCNKRQPSSGCGALEGYNRMHAIFGASNKCIAVHPSDMCIALAALDATVTVSGPKAERKIKFIEFHRLPGDNPEKDNTLLKGELITSVSIPKNPFTKNVYYLKIRDRSSYAFALVSVAVALELHDDIIKQARLAMGGVAHKPWRLTAAENFLKGKTITTANFQHAATIAMKDAKSYGHNNFKLALAPNAVIESLKTASGLS
ncbi:MAG TPA: xanthine dehydrogenase family protein subunit M [Chitinophagaceae bacterium]|nr:xanthine dehydrogenase family protein subunit M [Chitinophagaceae bacterium]